VEEGAPDNSLPNAWGPGQVLAFSALDGPTDYDNALVLRTGEKGASLEAVLPDFCRMEIAPAPPRLCTVAGDFFELTTSAGYVRGAFIDACQVLIEGPCRVERCGAGVVAVERGSKLLVGSAGRFDVAHLDDDLDALMAARRAWLGSIPRPAGMPPERQAALARALSILKTQVCSDAGENPGRWTTPDR